MNKQSVKRRRVEDDVSAIANDRLSQLPQPILHHILSLLSQKDAVRTCVLSKSWRYLWQGRLNLELRDDNTRLKKNDEFWSFLDKTLQRYLDQNLSLHKFLVDVFFHEVDFVLLQKWIPLLIMNMCVSSFTLILPWSSIVFPLPLIVFQSQSIVELHLVRCDLRTLKSTDNVMLYNLQTLCLHDVYITDNVFEKIISSCPLIENLDLLRCIGLTSITLRKHHNIKYFACSVRVQTIIKIEDTHPLESVRIQQKSGDWFLPHKNMQFPHLKSLDLCWVHLPSAIFDNFSSSFPCLNELSLNQCKGMEEFILSSSSIKRLTIEMDVEYMTKAVIDTPNILYFKYIGILPSIKFKTTSDELKSEILLWYKLEWWDKNTTEWFLKLNKLLKTLSQSHITLTLVLNEYKKLRINDSYGDSNKPVVVEHLKLRECFPSSDPAILDCLFRICRPRYIYMYWYDNRPEINHLTVFMSKLISNEIGCYFWLKDLEEVGIEVRDEQAKEWHCVEWTSVLALSFSKWIRFRLTWREQ